MWPFGKIKKLKLENFELKTKVNALEEYETCLKTKIQVLSDIAKLKDSESKLYRELLEEIGAQIDIHPDIRPLYEERYGEFIPYEPIKITHVRLDKRFMGSEEPLQKLKKIDELIAEMHRERRKVLDEGNSV